MWSPEMWSPAVWCKLITSLHWTIFISKFSLSTHSLFSVLYKFDNVSFVATLHVSIVASKLMASKDEAFHSLHI